MSERSVVDPGLKAEGCCYLLNAACGLIAVVEGVDWGRVSHAEKQRARALVASLRRGR